MAVVAQSEAIHELVAPDARIERIASGFVFTEGPVWHPLRGDLLFSDIPADRRYRFTEDGGASVDREPNNKANGMTYDLDLNLIVCEHATSAVVRELPDGARQTIASHFDGNELNSPNDVVVDSDGGVYFTDPTYGRMPGYGLEREQQLPFQGVFRIPPQGGLELLADDFGQPNGLCFSPDESRLYVDDSERDHIRVFELHGNRSLGADAIFAAEIRNEHQSGGVDGMKCDERGNVWVTGPGGIWVFSPIGEHLGVIVFPEDVANLNWGGPDWRWLFVTATTSVYRIQTRVAGNRAPVSS
jgi:gluconolactonase